MPVTNKKDEGNKRLLAKYLGLATQFMIGLAIAVFAGLKADQWFSFSTPIFVWVLPLMVVTGLIWQIVKDTSNK